MGSTIHAISDEEIIDMLNSGLIEVPLETEEPIYFAGKLKAINLCGCKKSGQRFRVEIQSDGKKRTILVNRLVYLAGTRKPIPPGFEIHHIDGNRHHDRFSNLIMVTVADHQKLEAYKHAQTDSDIPF